MVANTRSQVRSTLNDARERHTREELDSAGNDLSLHNEGHAKIQLVRNDDGVAAASTDTVQELDHVHEHFEPSTVDGLGDSRVGVLLRVVEDLLEHHIRASSKDYG